MLSLAAHSRIESNIKQYWSLNKYVHKQVKYCKHIPMYGLGKFKVASPKISWDARIFQDNHLFGEP